MHAGLQHKRLLLLLLEWQLQDVLLLLQLLLVLQRQGHQLLQCSCVHGGSSGGHCCWRSWRYPTGPHSVHHRQERGQDSSRLLLLLKQQLHLLLHLLRLLLQVGRLTLLLQQLLLVLLLLQEQELLHVEAL